MLSTTMQYVFKSKYSCEDDIQYSTLPGFFSDTSYQCLRQCSSEYWNIIATFSSLSTIWQHLFFPPVNIITSHMEPVIAYRRPRETGIIQSVPFVSLIYIRKCHFNSAGNMQDKNYRSVCSMLLETVLKSITQCYYSQDNFTKWISQNSFDPNFVSFYCSL